VWKYRQAFEKQLPAIFAHFAEVYDRLLVYSGTIAADVFRQQVDAVLTIWERW
jgi:U2-associated protein SR140